MLAGPGVPALAGVFDTLAADTAAAWAVELCPAVTGVPVAVPVAAGVFETALTAGLAEAGVFEAVPPTAGLGDATAGEADAFVTVAAGVGFGATVDAFEVAAGGGGEPPPPRRLKVEPVVTGPGGAEATELVDAIAGALVGICGWTEGAFGAAEVDTTAVALLEGCAVFSGREA